VQERLKKRYLALCEFGHRTITGDLDGEVVEAYEEGMSRALSESVFKSVERVSSAMVGEYWQRPPYFSAVKHDGKPLYEYARKGVYIEKDPVCRTIYELEVKRSDQEFHYLMNCSVSNGTYIRGLWQDMLEEYKKLGHLKVLTRTDYGPINQKDCVDLEDFSSQKDKPFSFFTPWSLLKFPMIELSKPQASAFLQGAFLPLDGVRGDKQSEVGDGDYLWVTLGQEVLGLAVSFIENGSIKVKAEVNFY
jgi:tRNA pseudouridine55 synthase